VLRIDGRSDFGELQTTRDGAQASLVAFDILRHDGDDLRLRSIEERRSAIRMGCLMVRSARLRADATKCEAWTD
jgi:hypothetical protein